MKIVFNCLNCGTETTGHHSAANKYCNLICQGEYHYKKNVADWLAGRISGNKGIKSVQVSNFVKKYLEEKFNHKCVECGQGKIWNNKPLTLQVEHIDGDSSNTIESNLSLLCPHCHTQTPFYGSKNKGRGRGSKYKAGLV